jgi:hypothetical protein
MDVVRAFRECSSFTRQIILNGWLKSDTLNRLPCERAINGLGQFPFAVGGHHDFNRRQLLFSFLSVCRSGRTVECFFANAPAKKPALRFRMPVEPRDAPNLGVIAGDSKSLFFTAVS